MLAEEDFLTKHFRGYYGTHQLVPPLEIEKREFGTGDFGRKISTRHLTFSSAQRLNLFLQKTTPLYISYSVALYSKPDARPMQNKQMLGADLLYEFDADDLKTDCKQQHDSWHCKCGANGKGTIERCTLCGSGISLDQWFCPSCLGETKRQIFSLIDFLENDFGFSNGIAINFSGNAGYHLHIRNEFVRSLRQPARTELLDYLTANNINLASHGFTKQDRMLLCPKQADAKGWPARILRELRKLIMEAKPETIAALGAISNKTAKLLLQKRELIIENMDKGILYSIPGRKTELFWNNLADYIVRKSALGIDRQTSIDINKIIRLPDSLHGGTGLIAKSIARESLQDFQPLRDCLAFGDTTVKVFISKAPKFYLGEEQFGPFEETTTELPLYAAIYLVAKARAKVQET